jgi:tetratricopeptide (TPR) repeat protein
MREERRPQAAPVAEPAPARVAALAGGITLAVALLVAACGFAWGQLRGDVLIRLAGWSQVERKYEQALAQVARASAVQPRERSYLMTMGTRRLQRAVEQLGMARGGEASQFMFIADDLRRAEADLRAAQALAPGDPWVVLSLANVVQIEGMRALRPLMGEAEGAAKAAQARRLFERAHALFPVQTTVLRNWAQLEFDDGDSARAYALLDQMEALAPASEAPYVERLLMARQAGDAALFEATVARARQHLPDAALARLRAQLPGMD